MKAELVLVTLHVAANMVWVGSLISSAVVALAAGGPTQAQAKLGRALYTRLAAPAFGVSFVLGAVRLGLDWNYYMVTTHFMHAKLALAFVAIVAHHWVGARLKRLCDATPAPDRSLGLATAVFAIACLGSVALVVMRPF